MRMTARKVGARRVSQFGGAAVIAALVLTACGNGAESNGADGNGSDGEQVPLTFAIGSPNLEITTAPYAAVPQEMGFWEDEGLDVDLQGTEGATASVQMLMGGRADIINGGTSSFYQEAVRSDEIQVIQLIGPNMWRTYVPEDSPIESLEELEGETVGAQSLSSASYLFGVAALESAGVDGEEGVEWLPVGTGNQAAEAINTGDVEAYASYDGPAGVVGNLTDNGLRALPSALDDEVGLLGIATTKTMLEEQPEVVENFLIGMLKGALFSAENPEAAIDIQFEAFPEQRPQGDWQQVVDEMMPVAEDRFVNGGVRYDDMALGTLEADDIQQSIDLMEEFGVITETVDANEVLALDLNNAAWESVDPDEITEMARDYDVNE